MANQIRHNWTYDPGRVGYQDPAYEKSGYPTMQAPPITAFGNIQYMDFIKMVKDFWENMNPEIPMYGVGDDQRFDPQKGYIIHSLVRRVPKDGFPKTRFMGEYCNPETDDVLLVHMQPFINLVKFSAVHVDTDVADQIIEEFETFFIQAIPFLMRVGAENIFYHSRLADDKDTRDGRDVAVRSLTYDVILQKIIYTSLGVLQTLYIRTESMLGHASDATPSLPAILEFIKP